MAVTHGIKKQYSSFLGLNEIVDDISRDVRFATEANNVHFMDDGSLAKRRGYKIFDKDVGGYGIEGFDNIDPDTGAVTKEILIISDTISRMKTAVLTLTNNSLQDVSIAVFGVNTQNESTLGWGQVGWGGFPWGDPLSRGYHLTVEAIPLYDSGGDLTASGATTDYYLADEVELTGPTIATLITQLASNAYISAAATDETTTPAPFLELLSGETMLAGETLELTYYYAEEVNGDSASGFSLGFADFKTSQDAFHIDTARFNRSIYFTTGLDPLQQYDGNSLFRAGMEAGTKPTVTSAGAGVLAGDYLYKVQPWFKDRNGQTHYGAIGSASTSISVASKQNIITITNVEEGNGFDARGGHADGAQSAASVSGAVTLVIDDGGSGNHTIEADDKIRLFNSDAATNAYAEYRVTATTTSTVTVTSSVTIGLVNGVRISTGISLDLYRTISSGTTYSLVAQINNDPFNATQTYTDNTADASLGARFLEPLRTPAEPPTTKFITTFDNYLLLGNKVSDPNIAYYSEPDAPTNFPALNSFSVESDDGGVITALAQSSDSLIIFREKSVYLMVGDLARDTISVTQISSGGIGCKSHKTVVPINGVLFFLGDRGVYTMVGAGIPKLISGPVTKSLTTKRIIDEEILRFTRAVAIHHVQDKQYILYIPAEETLSGELYANSSSLNLVYSYDRDSWAKWTGVNASTGLAYADDKLWFSSREVRSDDLAVNLRVWRQHNDGEVHDYADQLDTVDFEYGTGWESAGSPVTAKKFLRLKLYSLADIDTLPPLKAFVATTTTEIDYKEHATHSSLSFSFPSKGASWDSKSWDSFPWGGEHKSSFKSKLRRGQARSLRVVLANEEYNTNVLFTGYELEYAAPQGNTIKG